MSNMTEQDLSPSYQTTNRPPWQNGWYPAHDKPEYLYENALKMLGHELNWYDVMLYWHNGHWYRRDDGSQPYLTKQNYYWCGVNHA
jgi:hypothetical protein